MSDLDLVTLGGQFCPVCRHGTRLSMDVGDFQLYECPRCRCYSSNARIRGAELPFVPTNYFENAYADCGRWDELFARLSKQDLPIASVLDVGCGTGAFLEYFRRNYSSTPAVGIELDSDRAQQAQDLNPWATIHAGDALKVLANVSDEFDLITLWDVFEHVPSPGMLLEALSQRLSARGRIFIQTINEHSLLPRLGRLSYKLTRGQLRGIARRTHAPHHLVFFSPGGIHILAQLSGLRIRERWFDRLDSNRMDAKPAAVAIASVLMKLENAFGNGLFLNVILDRVAD